MIRVRIKGSPDKIEGFMVWGHAGLAPGDGDIVCAGVSAVSTAALIGLAELVPGSARYKILPQGLMYCRLVDGIPKAGAQKAQAVLAAMALGLEAMQARYGDRIDFAYRR